MPPHFGKGHDVRFGIIVDVARLNEVVKSGHQRFILLIVFR